MFRGVDDFLEMVVNHFSDSIAIGRLTVFCLEIVDDSNFNERARQRNVVVFLITSLFVHRYYFSIVFLLA